MVVMAKHVLLKLTLMVLVATMVSAQQCSKTRLCPANLCCSGAGYCGSTTMYCGTGCLSGPCKLATTGVVSHVSKEVITPVMFDELFSARLKNFYTYESFVEATVAFSEFGTIGDLAMQKREIAAFFAHIHYESSGLSMKEYSVGGEHVKSYCYQGPNNDVDGASFTCTPGKKYFPRGPMQLTWNYNYGSASQAVGADLVAQPELVSENAVISFKTALWKWMTPEGNKPSSHQVMVEQWTPSSSDIAAKRHPGFGSTINVLKGKMECGHASLKALTRIALYLEAARVLGVAGGENLYCDQMTPFGSPV